MIAKYLKEYENELNICIRCAYCFEGCPVFKELGWESDGARGKAILAYGLLTGELKPSKYIADKIFQCTYCRDCLERCSPSVKIPEILCAARADLVDAGFVYETHKGMVENVKRTGNIFGDEEVTTPVQEGEIPVYIGCQYLARPNQAKLYIRILEKIGVKPLIKNEICCGFPLYALGFREEFKKWKTKFIELFPYKEMIALCPTCAAFLHEEYGKEIKHVTQIILEHIPEANLGIKATYHDPCDLSRVLNIIEEPREILKKIGVKLVEIERSKKTSYCCGGGGGILMSNVELSDRIGKVRIRQAIDTGAPMVITPCPTCEQVLKKAAALEGNIVVRNISDIIWKALS
ncbi:MAG: (Fe-S)-binding protein [bacterium]|nr:(Fe-S)-binding protein [bacterium]